MQNNIIDIIKRPNFLELKFITILLLVFTAIQLFVVFNFDPYPESQTIISWYYSQVGIIETLGMRVGEDNTIKGTYSFIYLLPSYIFFICFKFFLFSDFTALSLANFIIINSQFFFLILVSRKLSLNIMVASLIYILFFLTTYMWSGLIRIFPHDMLIILALLQLLFPKLKYILMVFMVYLDPIIGSLFVFFYFVLENWSSFKMIIYNFFTHFFKIFFIVLIGFSLWIIPILYLENIVGYEVSRKYSI